MKRFISILFMISLCTLSVFAEDDFEEQENQESQEEQIETPETEVQDENYVYEPNGAGDQFLKIGLMANFPLNFDGKLYVGGGAELGYYRFLTSTIALGGEVAVAYNVSVGEKPLITVPITFGAMFQPYIGRFEFPITASVGFASLSCQGMSYFPALTVKAGAGAFYRITETWSLGLNGEALWIPQWVEDPTKNDNGFFATAGIIARYHF